jgi:ABC-2 type transport system ATP-binding protein
MVSVTNLKKSYDSVQALKGVSFSIKPGEFYGLLGPNGAGKTTTIGIMSTIIQADEGEVIINGIDLKKDPVACKKAIGVVPQEIALYNDLSAYDNLVFWGSLYNVPKGELLQRIDTTLNLFGLFDRRKDKLKTYSGGMKRRINIASALLHSPKILFMDEPTVGVDPQSRNLIFEVIDTLHREGMTMIYTTHYMQEAEQLCDRIGIIDNGMIIAQGTLDELKNSSKIKETIVVTLQSVPAEALAKLSTTGIDFKSIGNEILFFTNNVKGDLSKVILKCSELGLDILNIDIQKVNLETIFLNLTGKQLRD